MRQSPISFKFFLTSLAASLIINGAAGYIIFLNFHHRRIAVSSTHQKIMLVDMVNQLNKKEAAPKKNVATVRRIAPIKNINHEIIALQKPAVKKIHKITLKKFVVKRKAEYEIVHKISIKKAIYKSMLKKAKNMKQNNIKTAENTRANEKPPPIFPPRRWKPGKIEKPANITPVIQISKSSYKDIFLWINRHKFYPTEALYKNEQGKIGLSFIIKNSGRIGKIDILKPSEFKSLNEAALKIVQSSSPIPKNIINKISHLPTKAVINISFRIE